MARTPTSVPGSRRPGTLPARSRLSPAARDGAGFTLVELLVVMVMIAIASTVASLALRDPAATRLDREAVRLAALLESARVEARSAGLAVRWEPTSIDSAGNVSAAADGHGSAGFRFAGMPAGTEAMPTRWLNDGVSAEVVGARAVLLGPDPVIPPQRIVLRLDNQQVVLATDGLSPFAVPSEEPASNAP